MPRRQSRELYCQDDGRQAATRPSEAAVLFSVNAVRPQVLGHQLVEDAGKIVNGDSPGLRKPMRSSFGKGKRESGCLVTWLAGTETRGLKST